MADGNYESALSIASENDQAHVKERTKSFEDDLNDFDDGVGLSDVTSSYKDMMNNLNDYKEQKHNLD